MGILTNFLKLLKPEPNDFVDVVKHISENYDKLDQNAETTNQTLTNLSSNKLDKSTYNGDAATLKADIDTRLLKGTYSGDAGKLKEDIDTKMSKYQTRYDIKDYDDLTENGFYILYGSSGGIANSPYNDAALVQVWAYDNLVYQRAVSPYNQNVNFFRCFNIGTKNVMWTTSCPYSIGDIYCTMRNEHPAVIWPYTSWEKIENRFLLATSGTDYAGKIGGSHIKTIEQVNLPNVKLQVDPFSLSVTPPDIQLYKDYSGNNESGSKTLAIEGSASRAGWSNGFIRINSGGTTGIAQPYTSALGSGIPLNVVPAYYTVHIWKRIA